MPWSEWKSLSGDLKVEKFDNISKGVWSTVTLSETPKKLIILQTSSGYGLSFPADVDMNEDSVPTDYYCYDYTGIKDGRITHDAFSQNISFNSNHDGTVTVRYI